MSNYRINIENIYPDLKANKKKIKHIAQTVLFKEGISTAEINIILVDDKYIIRLNHEFLNKEQTTDVISFNLTDNNDRQLAGEVYANVEQIIRQADDFHVPFNEELSRIVIHGLLHLIGFDDQTGEDKKNMIEKEEHYLEILKSEL